MKKYSKWLVLIIGLLSFSQVFAQYGRYGRRYHDRYYYYSRPYYYPAVHTSVSVIARLPFGAIAVTLGSRHYHYYGGRYYEPMSGGYMMVEPPVGIIVPSLPPGYVSVVIGGRPYYRYQSVYYLPVDNNRYQVVAEPKEEKASPKIASSENNDANNGYEKLVLEGKTYYKKGDKFYKAKVDDNGEIVYEEVGQATK